MLYTNSYCAATVHPSLQVGDIARIADGRQVEVSHG